jgi:hypothetical protein
MDKLKKIPREEDLDKAKGYPSVKAYVDRFGSWQNAVDMFANKDLAKRKCLNCGKLFIRTKKTNKFCSKKCQLTYHAKKSTTYTKAIDKKIKEILGGTCFICDFPYMLEVHCLDNKKESNHKILAAYNKKDLHSFILLCPNHHLMLHNKLAKLYKKNDELIWEE